MPRPRRPGGPGKRPATPAPPPPPVTPPPPAVPPARPPTAPKPFPGGKLPRGFTTQAIIAYVVANGFIWAIDAAGRWIRERPATAAEILSGVARNVPRLGPRPGAPAAPPGSTPPRVVAPPAPRAPPAPTPPTARPVARPQPPPRTTQDLEAIVITAKRLPVPAPPPAPKPLWQRLLALPGLGSLLKSDKAKAAKIKIGKRTARALTPANVPSVSSVSSFSSFYQGAAPGRTARCECPPKRKRRPKPPRSVCYSGTYSEKATGLRKSKRRRIPCR